MRADPWDRLRRYTPARIALGRAGSALPTSEVLALGSALAEARDAVWRPWDPSALVAAAEAEGIGALAVRTAVGSRAEYLRRPDLGRRLAHGEDVRLERLAGNADVALVVSNGLSSTAVDRHGLALVRALRTALGKRALAPLVAVGEGRVAVGDEIGAALGVRLTVLVIGERPGLSAADGLGIYLTWDPRPGRTDADRNCISNVRPPAGLSYEDAAARLQWLADAAFARQLSGVSLKDESVRALP